MTHEPTSQTNWTDIPEAEPPPELTETASLLDRLAVADRSEPDDGFEARLASVTRPGVVGRLDEADIADGHRSRGLLGRSWWMLPVAAALAVGVVFVRTGPPPMGGAGGGSSPGGAGEPAMTLASVEADLEAFLFVDGLAESQSVLADGGLSGAAASGSAGDDPASDGLSEDPADELLFDLLSGIGESL